MLARQLVKRHQLQVITHWDQDRQDWLLGTTLRAPQESCQYVIDGVPVHRMGITAAEKRRLILPVLLYYPLMNYSVRVIAQLLESHLAHHAGEADLIHNVRIGREGLSYASLQLARRKGIPFVFTPVHHPRWVGWRYNTYLALYKAADAVVALTESEKATLTYLGVTPEQIFVTGHGPVLAEHVSTEDFSIKHGIDGPFVLFLGQHYPYKGYRQLLEATPLVWRRYPEVHFVFIGPPKGDSERHFQAQQDGRVHRLGKVDLQVKTDALAACTLLCVPSTQESFGGVYTEAWMFKKPVIGCNIPAVAEVVTDEVDGYLVEQAAGEIAERILTLLAAPAVASQMGEAGHHKVHQKYTWPQLAAQTEQVYSTLLTKGRL